MKPLDAREVPLPAHEGRSVWQMLHDMLGNIQDIGRSEVRLIKTGIDDGVAEAGKPVAALGAGLVLAVYATGLLLVALVAALTQVMAMWAATLLAGGATAIVAAVLVVRGRAGVKRVSAKVDQTIASPRERVQWATQRSR